MKKIKALVSNEIWLKDSQVDESLEGLFKKELTFANPKVGELIRMGYSIWKVPKKIVCYKKLKSGYFLPLGFGPRLRQYVADEGNELIIDDKRIEKKIKKIKHHIELKNEQREAMEKILSYNRCILEAKPGFGKTMLGIYAMSEKKQKTIIIVHTRSLLQQWQKRLLDFCELEENEIGMIGEGKWKVGERVTIASYQTLLSRGTKDLKNEFGMVIVDECHHVPANTFAKVVRGLAAKYCLGLTATPFRKDRLDKLMNFYIGKIIPTSKLSTDSENNFLPQNKIKTNLFWRTTDLLIEDWEMKEYSELGSLLTADPDRLKLIVDDVRMAARKDGKIIVLSERVGHAEALYALIMQELPKVKMVLVTGQMKKNEREKLFEEIKANKYSIMVATGGVVGEGFDWPALDHLFLTFPFSWRGKLIQYVGRVQRAFAGKKEAFVYDYVDAKMSIFKAMQRKRWRGYKELGIED